MNSSTRTMVPAGHPRQTVCGAPCMENWSLMVCRLLVMVTIALLMTDCSGSGSSSPGPVATSAPTSAPTTVPTTPPRALNGTITEFSAGTAGGRPIGVTAGPDGNIWFTEQNGDRIGRITPGGTVTEFAVTAGSGPVGITGGPDGNLWFTEPQRDSIGRITPSGIVTEFSSGITTGGTAPNGVGTGAFPNHIVAGPDGNLWFTESNGNRIGRITPAGVVTEFSNGITPQAFPYGIARGSDGNLWFTEQFVNRIGRITPGGVVTEFSAGISNPSQPAEIAAGPDGNLWFTEPGGNRIGRITPGGAVTEFSSGLTTGAPDPFNGQPSRANPLGIAVGPDGNMWFTEFGTNRVGRITMSGVITEFSAGITGLAQPTGITAGPDGSVWFTEQSTNRIGRLR